MAQAGIHGLVCLPLRKLNLQRQWLVLGIVLGSLFPDADNLALAYTLSKGFLTIFGAVYLFSLGLALAVAVRMRATIEYA